MHRWREKLQQVASARNLDTPAASKHIAALLGDVSAALLKGRNKSLIAVPVDEATEVHGLQRFQEGFSLIDIVADYNALRETIQEFAEANRITVTGRVRSILDRVLDKAIAVAVETYSEQKALEIQRQRQEYLSLSYTISKHRYSRVHCGHDSGPESHRRRQERTRRDNVANRGPKCAAVECPDFA